MTLFPSIRPAVRGAALLALMLWPVAAAAFPNHNTYDLVLGQVNKGQRRINGPGDRALSYPIDVALDKTHTPNNIYLADHNNGRVLAWCDAAQFRAGAAPTFVLGQEDGTRVDKFRVESGSLSLSNGLAVDEAGTLWVSDRTFHRVLGFFWPCDPAKVAMMVKQRPADVVIGRDMLSGTSRTASAASAMTFNQPGGLAADGDGNLFVADTQNFRVLRFVVKDLRTHGAAAGQVIGQKDFVTRALNRGAMAPTDNTLGRPASVTTHKDGATLRLYVADPDNSRVLVFDDPVKGDGTDIRANRVFGQPDFVTATEGRGPGGLARPVGVAVDQSRIIWISDQNNHRVVGFPSPMSGTAGFGAAYVLGQLDAGGSLPNQTPAGKATLLPTALSLNAPARAAADGTGRLFVPDQTNHRVLVYDTPTLNPAASFAFGQPDLVHGREGKTTATGLAYPVGVAVDRPDPASRPGEPMHVYVADFFNSRVLGWWDLGALQDGRPADLVIGQRTMNDYACNMGRGVSDKTLCWPRGVFVDGSGDVWVADTWNHRVLRFPRPFSGPRIPVANLVLGQPSFLSSLKNGSDTKVASATGLWHPSAVVVDDAGVVYVADRDNDRVVGYRPPLMSGMAAGRLLIGDVMGEFNASGCPTRLTTPPTPNTGLHVCGPTGLALDENGNLWVAERDNNRVALYSATPPDPMSPLLSGTPLTILGQANRTSVGQNRGVPATPGAATLRGPEAVSVELTGTGMGRTRVAIVVADTDNHRVLAYPAAAATGDAATWLTGQPGFTGRVQNLDSTSNETPANVAQSMWSPAGVLALPEVLLIVDSGSTATFSNRTGIAEPGSNNTGNNRVIAIKGPTYPMPSGSTWTPPDGMVEEPDMMPAEEPDLRPEETPDLATPVVPADLRAPADLAAPPMPPGGCSCEVGGGPAPVVPVLLLGLLGLGLLWRRRRRA